LQKIDRVRKFGNNHVTIKLEGDTYDDAQKYAHAFEKEQGASYIHAFDDALTIAGQGTVGKELLEQYKDAQSPNIRKTPMVIVVPVGGGGLIAGIAAYAKLNNPAIEIIGAEPEGAASMYEAFKKKRPVALEKIDTFVDGTAVKRVGNLSFKLAKQYVSRIIKVPEGKIAKTMVELYQNEGIVTEPAGALSIAALSSLRKHIKGKTVVCIVSGGNNDILRYAEILERSLIYQGRKHYFIIQFAQKPGQLRSFLNRALGPTDDIVRFEYIKKTNTENGPALVGIEQQQREHYTSLVKRMDAIGLTYQVLSPNDLLYQYIV
ncbi:MAG TPA: threonine ammonia-lyase IlvA, partial [Patescibacteria group bacterium]|nr:threonine ammonia-lyase IlvA [Patescibacteria group bacterium]